jgi:hypothetical protein
MVIEPVTKVDSLDNKGKHVLIRDSRVENVIWTGDDIQDVDVAVLGLSASDQKRISAFPEAQRQ